MGGVAILAMTLAVGDFHSQGNFIGDFFENHRSSLWKIFYHGLCLQFGVLRFFIIETMNGFVLADFRE